MSTNIASSTDKVYAWNQYDGQKVSSSGNMYGIYDLSGGLWEKTAGYVANGNIDLSDCGSSLAWDGTNFITASTKYAKVYAHDTTKDNTDIGYDVSGETTKLDAASNANYETSENQLVYGDAIHETSVAGTGWSPWYTDLSYFHGLYGPFLVRGGGFWDGLGAGLRSFFRTSGYSDFLYGFRPVVVAL